MGNKNKFYLVSLARSEARLLILLMTLGLVGCADEGGGTDVVQRHPSNLQSQTQNKALQNAGLQDQQALASFAGKTDPYHSKVNANTAGNPLATAPSNKDSNALKTAVPALAMLAAAGLMGKGMTPAKDEDKKADTKELKLPKGGTPQETAGTDEQTDMAGKFKTKITIIPPGEVEEDCPPEVLANSSPEEPGSNSELFEKILKLLESNKLASQGGRLL